MTVQCLISVASHDFERVFGKNPQHLELNRGSVVKYLNTRLGPNEQLWHVAGFIGSSDAAIAAAWDRVFSPQVEAHRVEGSDCNCFLCEYPSMAFRSLHDEAFFDSGSEYFPPNRQVINAVARGDDGIQFKAWRVREQCQLILYVDADSTAGELKGLLETIALQPNERVREIRLYWAQPLFSGEQRVFFERVLEEWKTENFLNGRKKA
ncbi:MAG: hypothetical protein JST18_11960 [Bacteroidetes bacterium]|nr:hypothetical protein [Bacteroidota bacterium]